MGRGYQKMAQTMVEIPNRRRAGSKGLEQQARSHSLESAGLGTPTKDIYITSLSDAVSVGFL